MDLPVQIEARTKNRILVISEIGCGPPFLGNRARMHSLLKELRQLGLEVHFADVGMSADEKAGTLPFVDEWVATFNVTGNEQRDHTLLQRGIARLRRAMSRLRNRDQFDTDLDKWFRPHWMPQVRQLQRQHQYDRVLVSYVFHSMFLTAFGKDCLKILDTHDTFAGRNERLLARGITDTWFTTTSNGERKGLVRADVVLAIQQDEARYFEKLTSGKQEVRTVGHFLETPSTRPPDNAGNDRLLNIGFLASDNPLNLHGLNWFLEEVWPGVLLRVPDARLLLAGRICRKLEARNNIQLMGELNTVSDLYDRCLFTINPMREGTGLKIKTVESLAHGRTVVATSVAAAGIYGSMRKCLVVADQAMAFSQAVIQLLESPKMANLLGMQAVPAVDEMNGLITEELCRALRLTHRTGTAQPKR